MAPPVRSQRLASLTSKCRVANEAPGRWRQMGRLPEKALFCPAPQEKPVVTTYAEVASHCTAPRGDHPSLVAKFYSSSA